MTHPTKETQMSINDLNGEGNAPARNVVSKETKDVAGHITEITEYDDGNVDIAIPDTVKDDELETWQNKAINIGKAMKSANDKYSSAKRKEESVSERERRLQEKEDLLFAKMTELENKINSQSSKPQSSGNLYGFQSDEDLSNAFVDEPKQVLANFEEKIKKDYNRQLQSQMSELSMQVSIEREGYSYADVKAFANNLGTTINPAVYDTFKRVNSKSPAKSQFDDINKIQENSITFVKGSRGMKNNQPDDIFSRMDKIEKGKKNLNDI